MTEADSAHGSRDDRSSKTDGLLVCARQIAKLLLSNDAEVLLNISVEE